MNKKEMKIIYDLDKVFPEFTPQYMKEEFDEKNLTTIGEENIKVMIEGILLPKELNIIKTENEYVISLIPPPEIHNDLFNIYRFKKGQEIK